MGWNGYFEHLISFWKSWNSTSFSFLFVKIRSNWLGLWCYFLTEVYKQLENWRTETHKNWQKVWFFHIFCTRTWGWTIRWPENYPENPKIDFQGDFQRMDHTLAKIKKSWKKCMLKLASKMGPPRSDHLSVYERKIEAVVKIFNFKLMHDTSIKSI